MLKNGIEQLYWSKDDDAATAPAPNATRTSNYKGKPWYDRELPWIFHRCIGHTIFTDTDGQVAFLCACGGMLSALRGRWEDRNSRRLARMRSRAGRVFWRAMDAIYLAGRN